MIVRLGEISRHPRLAKVVYWSKLISVTGATQAIIQVIGLGSGILIIRMLSTKEYGFYTLANTMLGSMIVLADAGIATGVMGQAGQVWQDQSKLGTVLVTGMNLRRKFGVICLAISSPILIYLLIHQGSSWPMALLILVSLIVPFLSGLSGSILEIAPKLKQDIIPLQGIQLRANVLRLILIPLGVFFLPFASVTILVSGIHQLWANMKLKQLVRQHANIDEVSNELVQNRIMAVVKRVLPYTVYYCISGQLTIWLLSFNGSTSTIAQAGALGRLNMALGIVSILFGTLIVPRFSRIGNDSKSLFANTLKIQLGFLFFSIVVIGFVIIFPNEILWVLGKKYQDLEKALFLSVLTSCINLGAGSLYTLYSSRGWAMHPMVSVSISVLAVIVGAALFDVSSLIGILTLNVFISAIQYIMNGVFLFLKINSLKSEDASTQF